MDAINPGSPAIGSDNPSADYDESYQFGRRPNVRAPWPFNDRQFARLLIARGRFSATLSIDDQPDVDLGANSWC